MPPPPNYIEAFVDYLRAEVNASPMTIHAYSVDLRAFVAYTEERLGEPFTPTEHDLGRQVPRLAQELLSLPTACRCPPGQSHPVPASPQGGQAPARIRPYRGTQ